MTPATRKEALDTGQPYYFTGKACKNGHVSKRAANGNCLECLQDAHKRRTGSYLEWMFSAKKANAKRKKIPFDITIEDLVVPDKCPVLGIDINREPSKSMRGNAPTIDRINPAIGYVKGNICVISHRANRKKQDSTVDELRKILAYMELNQ